MYMIHFQNKLLLIVYVLSLITHTIFVCASHWLPKWCAKPTFSSSKWLTTHGYH